MRFARCVWGVRVCMCVVGLLSQRTGEKRGKLKKRNGSFGVSLNGMGRIFHGRDERIF